MESHDLAVSLDATCHGLCSTDLLNTLIGKAQDLLASGLEVDGFQVRSGGVGGRHNLEYRRQEKVTGYGLRVNVQARALALYCTAHQCRHGDPRPRKERTSDYSHSSVRK